MLYRSSFFILLLMLCCEHSFPGRRTVHVTDCEQQPPAKNKDVAAKWNIFWKNFSDAVDAKDKKKIAALTSPEFYDGGGSTVEQWLDAEVFANDKAYTRFKALLKKPVNSFRRFDGNPYKATGKNKSGDLFFEYRKGQWLFGGMVGD